MNPETFFDQFGLLADTPDGVQKLRELILQLAVQGKLVPQDPNDEPAAILLEKIKAEKERLVREGEIKKNKLIPFINCEKLLYNIPKGWKWVNIGSLGQTQTGTTPSKNNPAFFGNDYPFIKPSDISNKCINCDNEGLSNIGIKNGRFIKSGSILMVCIGGSIGKVNLIDKDCSCNQQINVLTPFFNLDCKLFTYFMRSPYFQNEVIGRSSKSTLPILNKSKWELIPFPLPPLNEQRRIVAKVDQLMALCDELEARQQKKQEARLRLNSAALDKLLTGHEPAEFANHWQRVCDNFDLLYDNPEIVGELRKAILQLAVQGKLVRQDENDEPAAVLLEKIKAEKGRLVKEGIIKKGRVLPPINQKQMPYELPSGWEWVRLGDVGHDCGQKKPDIKFTYIDVSAINKERGVISDNFDILEPNEAPSRARKLVSEGSVIYATVRPYLLNIAIIDRQFEPEPIVSTAFAVIHPFSGILNKYLYFYLRSKPFIAYVESEMIGMAYPAINDGKLYQGLVPVPPSKEQHRIVAKVDQLMALCDELEAKLNQSQADGAKLMGAVVAELVGA